MEILKRFLTKNNCYIQNKSIVPKGIMIHSVGCPQPNAEVFVSSWNNNHTNVCVHAFIDANTGNAYQTLPWNVRGWHCGSGTNGSANNTHIGVELCEPATIKYTIGSSFDYNNPEQTKTTVRKTYTSAVDLFSKLCREFSLDPLKDGVIISHKEGFKRGIASNHGDPEHIWGVFGLSMEQFRLDIKNSLTADSQTNISDWARDAWEWAKGIKFFDGTRPKDYATREEVISLFHRFKELK